MSDDAHTSGKEGGKKPFNKKEWRRRKYSNKYKVERWEQRRRKGLLHSYHKELRKMPEYSREERDGEQLKLQEHTTRKPRLSVYQMARNEYERKVAEKKAKMEEIKRKKEEKEEALTKYRAKKAEIYKKLSMKTKKGQPVMKGRMELLLEKLRKDLQS